MTITIREEQNNNSDVDVLSNSNLPRWQQDPEKSISLVDQSPSLFNYYYYLKDLQAGCRVGDR